MPGHAPYLMPDGQPLSKYLTLEKEDHSEKKRARRRHSNLRGKDEIWAHLKRQQADAKQKGDQLGDDEFGTVAKMGSRRRTRWINDKMLRDMTGPMTMDQIEAQFCPPPWGEMPKKEDPFHVLFDHHRSLWELLRRIDMGTEQTLLESMKQKRFENKERRPTGARAALKAWQRISRDHRNFLKKVNATVVLEVEMPLVAFKLHRKTSLQNERSCLEFQGQSRCMLVIYEAICQFHGLKMQSEARLDEESKAVYDVVVLHGRQEGIDGSIVEADGSEIACSDVIMALQEMKPEPLNVKTLTQFVAAHIHGTDEAQ